MQSALLLALPLPRHVLLNSSEPGKSFYLRVINENGESHRYLQSSELHVESPYIKFEVEMAREASNVGLVHIRSCQNNRYWVRPSGDYWISATACKAVEDQSQESCTLFKPIPVDDDAATNKFRLMHVQSGCYMCVWDYGSSSTSPFNRCVLAKYKVFDGNKRDIFTILDWDSMVFLPKYVAFKGDNDRYLCLSWTERHPYLMFSATDIGDPAVPQEVFVTHDGNIRLKPTSYDRFWRRSPNWIWADSGDTSSSNSDTLFRPVKVDDQTIALLNLGNKNFCKRLTTEGKTSCLNAAVASVVREAQVKVEEPVLTRSIYNAKYLIEDARVYDAEQLLVAKNSASNYTKETNAMDVKLSYTDTKTTTWKTNASLKLGAKITFEMGIPLIFEGTVQLSGEFQSAIEWSKTTTITTVVEVTHKTFVPPMTKVTVNLLATMGKCDVPFSFTQRDVLYNGKTVVTEVEGGTFTGSNYYNITFETIQEKLPCKHLPCMPY